MEQRLILINLLIKLGVAASAASILGRSVEFKSLLFRDERNWKQKIYLVLWIGIPLALGVWIRFSARSFAAGDLSFETTMLLGVIAGRLAGVLGGVLLALPALWHGEWATLPFNVLCGFVAGQLRIIAPNREDIWSFSPFMDLSIYRWIRRNLPTPHPFEWQTMFFVTIVGLRFVQTELSRFAPSAPSAWRVQPVGGAPDLRHFGHGHRNRTQDLEQRPHSDQAGGAGTPAAACPHGGAAKPDQSRTSCLIR